MAMTNEPLPVTPAHPMYAFLKEQREAAAAPLVPKFLPRRAPRYVLGVDLGQSSDPTAVCALEHVRGVIDRNSDFDRHIGLERIPQEPVERFDVRHLERLALGTPYPQVVEHIKATLARAPICGNGPNVEPARLVVDDTGVGRPVSDLLVDAGLSPLRVTIVSGNEVTWH